MPDYSTPVLVLGSAHHGGLAVVRSLGRLGVDVSVLEADRRTPAFSSRYCRAKHVWDLERAPVERSLAYLAGIARGFGRRAILLPTIDSAALFIAAHADELRRHFLFSEAPYTLAHSLHSKKEMGRLAASLGVPTPNTFFPQSLAEARMFAHSAVYPIMLKPVEERGAKNPMARRKLIVHGMEELMRGYEAMEAPDGANVMFQEYIPGGEETSWMFNGYFDRDSECLFGLTGRKIRQNRPYAGVTSLGEAVPNEEIDRTTRLFMKKTGYRGILDIGYRYDARDGRYKVFDVNPRVGCTFRLFVSENGMDAVRAMYLDLTGQPVEAGRAVPGRRWMVEDMDVAASMRYWLDGDLAAGDWLRSFRGVRETAFFAADDPRPVAAMLASDARQILQTFRRVPGAAGGRPVPWYSINSVFHGAENLISSDLRRLGHIRSSATSRKRPT